LTGRKKLLYNTRRRLYKSKGIPTRLQPVVANNDLRVAAISGEGGAGRVAWMRMMGAGSVGHHEHTVAGRGDDPVAGALDNYASRGETPMVWGGSGGAWLGLDGEVDLDEWRAVFATGGAHHPVGSERLVGCMRPGIEIAVSPHKTVAELGVIGRAEDMHKIVDAEREATMAYLDEVVMDRGGRRGRAQARTPTSGLTWAVSRHATTRAGDPQVHDHVLVANVVRMGDEGGGWKGLDTGLLRDHLHAAAAVGRMAAARRSSWVTASRPTPAPPAVSVDGPSPASRGRPGKSTPTGRPRSTKPSALVLPSSPGRWRLGQPGNARPTSPWRTW
jgi:hypothetical protein